MPAAAIGAIGAVAGGVASGKGASRAAQLQADATNKQTQALQAMYETNKGLMMPTYNNGAAAQARQQTLLGLSGGDGADAQKILADSPGYRFSVEQSMKAANAGAYASGMGNSGAAMKALQDRGNSLATQNYNNYVGQLGTVADRGVTAMQGLVQQGNQTTTQTNAVTQSGADAASANAVYQGNNLSNVIKGLAGSAGQAFGSSYSGGHTVGGSPVSNKLFGMLSKGNGVS